MKIFISQPVKDKTDEQIKQKRENIVDLVQDAYPDENIEVIDSYFEDSPEDATAFWFIGESIKLLADADLAVFAKDWEHYDGCTIEHECAVRYGKEIIYE